MPASTVGTSRTFLNAAATILQFDNNGSGVSGSDAAQTLYVGRGNANYGIGNNGFDGTLDWVYFWKRTLSVGEVLSLTLDPFAMFQPTALDLVGGTASSAVTGTGSVAFAVPALAGTGSAVSVAVGIGNETFAKPALAGTGTYVPPGGPIGITQIPTEVAEQTDVPVLDVTQIAVEAIYAFSGTCGIPVPDVGVTFPVRRVRTFLLPTSPEGRWIFLRRLQILLQAGVGLSTGVGTEPWVMLQVSRDGGQTWGPERWVTAGRIGEYDAQAYLVNCGRYRDGAVRLVVTDPVAWKFLSADADLMEGTS